MPTDTPPTVAFIGLGTMGYPMAGHLAAAGYDVRVFNRTAERAAHWAAEHRGHVAATPAEAADGADVVCTCVGGDPDVREVVLGDDGALAAMAPGTVLVDHTTASAVLAEELGAACREAGVGFVDAPISGGQAGAEAGRLSVMCGGEADDLVRARPALEAYGTTITHVGPVGHGQLNKMVNQILCAGAIAGAAEALNFAMQAGLDTDQVLAAVSKGAANSWYLENRGHTMVADEFDFGFAVDWIRKDLEICVDQARRLGVSVPLTERSVQDYVALQERGDGRADATVMIRLRRAESDAG
jgi:3-hydroxyisobutyrate dehydrogenase